MLNFNNQGKINIIFSQSHRYHDFKSYSSHKLFVKPKKMMEDNACGYGGMLDHIYNLDSI